MDGSSVLYAAIVDRYLLDDPRPDPAAAHPVIHSLVRVHHDEGRSAFNAPLRSVRTRWRVGDAASSTVGASAARARPALEHGRGRRDLLRR
jgi:hypothetical protein